MTACQVLDGLDRGLDEDEEGLFFEVLTDECARHSLQRR